MIPAFTIICEGPSAALATKADCLPGPVVAINMAIRADLPLNVWASVDDPAKLWVYAKKRITPGMVVWGSENHRDAWKRLGFEGDRAYLWRAHLMRPKEEEGLSVRSVLPTLFSVLVAAKQHGANLIRIIGADMRGTGTPFTVGLGAWENPGWVPEESERQAARWENERACLKHAARAFFRDGCVLEVYEPEGVVCLN